MLCNIKYRKTYNANDPKRITILLSVTIIYITIFLPRYVIYIKIHILCSYINTIRIPDFVTYYSHFFSVLF